MSNLPFPALLKGCLQSHETFTKVAALLDAPESKQEFPEFFQLGQCIKYLRSKGEQTQSYTVNDLELSYQTLYPAANLHHIKPLLTSIKETEVSDRILQDFTLAFRQRQAATKLAQLALAVAEGREEPTVLIQFSTQLFTETKETQESDFIDDTDFDALYAKTIAQGLRWRLPSLNKALGSLRKGDFGFLFARPETGKTTFLASELTYMASQLKTGGPILWFANEEAPEKILSRLIQAALGKGSDVLSNNRDRAKNDYHRITQSRIKLPRFELCNRSDIERIATRDSPSLIVFDQIDKIRGFQADRNDLELTEIYLWARELAKRFCPVIGVSQAGASGEGKKWLTFNDVNNSKTGKQGEADWILGIGKSQDEALSGERFFYLSKNKLFGDADSDPSMRHGKWGVRILPEIARYEDFE